MDKFDWVVIIGGSFIFGIAFGISFVNVGWIVLK